MFEEAKQTLNSLLPQYNIISTDKETTVDLDFETNTIFDSMSLSAEFGSADSFSSFDTTTGKILISPDVADSGDYSITIMLTDGLQDDKSTMQLTVVGA